MRDVNADYRAAYLAEHAALVAAEQDIAAAKVAEVFSIEFGEDIPGVEPRKRGRPRKETAVASDPLETTEDR